MLRTYLNTHHYNELWYKRRNLEDLIDLRASFHNNHRNHSIIHNYIHLGLRRVQYQKLNQKLAVMQPIILL